MSPLAQGLDLPLLTTIYTPYTMASIYSSSCFSDESCFVRPFLSELWFNSSVFSPKVKLNKLSFRKVPLWINALFACLLSLAKRSSSFLWRCLKCCIRREQLILNMATILDKSAFISSLCLDNSTRLGREWLSAPTRKQKLNSSTFCQQESYGGDLWLLPLILQS